MKAITRPAVAILLLLITLTATTAQQKRQTTPKPQPKAPVTPTPAPTFDTLVPADTYIIYGEVRGAGQLIRSSALNEILEPVLKLSSPPKEFRTVVKWLNAHAEEMMTSRLLLATWPNDKAKGRPETIIAIEFASAEEATKFTATLNDFLPTVLPAPLPEPSAESSPPPDAAEKPKPPTPNFHLKRFGSLVVITPKAWTLKQLKPAGSKLLAEDLNFRAAHNRFNSEPVFVYLDTKAIKQQDQETRKRWEQERIEAEKRAEAEPEPEKSEEPPEPELTDEEQAAVARAMATLEATTPADPKEESAAPEPLSSALSGLASAFFDDQPEWPDGVGFALSFEGDSFDLRALLVNQAGERADAIPFMPTLIMGPAFTPEAPNIFPADTELLATMSLDLPQIYATLSKPRPKGQFIASHGQLVSVKEMEFESPFAEIEKRLKISIKDDLLPLLGSEISVRLPMKNMNMIGIRGLAGPMVAVKEEQEEQATNGPVLAIALKDKEAMRALMPKLVEAFGFKGANTLAQTERREDTEIISYANLFSYAFIGNFLVLSGEPATTRYVVDSYLKHETLSAESQFRISTRWQPKPQHGQLYISPSLMEGYKTWAEQVSTRVSDQTRAFLVSASAVAQPITYSLSNEGIGPLHEVHIPKSLVLLAVAGISGESNPPQTIQNERVAIGLMYTIAEAENQYKLLKGSCGTLEQLIAADLLSKEMVDNSGYRFELTVSGDKFEVSAVPLEYGQSGKLSLFINETRVLRGGDRNGATASASDAPIN